MTALKRCDHLVNPIEVDPARLPPVLKKPAFLPENASFPAKACRINHSAEVWLIP
jgi:hypothetical protein